MSRNSTTQRDVTAIFVAAADGVVGACDDDGVAATVERLLELPTD